MKKLMKMQMMTRVMLPDQTMKKKIMKSRLFRNQRWIRR
jgi:hypothetical protein